MKSSPARWLRWSVLATVTVVLALVAVLHQYPVAGWSPPGVDALCPFGGLESLWAFLTTGDLLTKITAGSFVLLVATVAVAAVFRRSFCGHLCPMGALQEGAAALGSRWRFQRRVPRVVDRVARWGKYVVLAVVTGATWVAGTLVVRPYDPWVAFMHLTSAELWTGFAVGAVVLFGSIAASLFVNRFFCRYLCPMGALTALVSRWGWFRVRREASACLSCGLCDRACPVGLPVSQGRDVTSPECLACGQCVTACPAKGALQFAGPKRTHVRPVLLTLATASVFTAVLVFSLVPAPSAPSVTFDPEAIKGRSTWAEVVTLTGIPREAWVERFGLTDEDWNQTLKTKVESLGMTTTEVRDWATSKQGVPNSRVAP